ncbi:MAG: hypothetical protein U0361_13265 [Nitrospiraceae bacterium]
MEEMRQSARIIRQCLRISFPKVRSWPTSRK